MGAHPDWRAIHDELARREPSSLAADELDRLGESLFWLDRPDDSIAVLGRAFTAHVADGRPAAAARTAWQLFYDHALVGEAALANGWLERARRAVAECEPAAAAASVAAGFLHVAEADIACWAGAPADAIRHATLAVALGRSTRDADLLAMARQAEGRALVAAGRVEEGIAALDEAMIAVVNDELAPLFAGWVFCNALSTCHDLADLHRAAQWTDAAMRWCEGIRDGRLYPGICRLHVVELASLRGTWDDAGAMAARACEELTGHDPRYAGGAHYLIGELHRLAGHHDLAEDAYARAHQLGRVPQPGLARLRLAQGRPTAALRALESELASPPAAPKQHVELLAALADAHLALGDLDDAAAAADGAATVAGAAGSDYLGALAALTDACVLRARGDARTAARRAAAATATFQSLGLRYDEARARAVRGAAAGAGDDGDTARLERAAARDLFRRLGAEPDARELDALLGEAQAPLLSARELDVLRLVARGSTNKEVASALFVSEHTVARHLGNIYTKLGVGSRSAATAFGYEHSLI